MILHPGVLALLAGSACVLVLFGVSCWHALTIVRRWDFSSSSAEQLALERRTHLVSTVVACGMGFQALSTFLFVHTVDDLHGVLTGAMCATGALNANPVGWYALGTKVALLFGTGLWLALNAVDRGAEDLPLVRLKFRVLLLLAPPVALDFWLQLRYFLGLRPDVITSCCGSLFTPEGKGLASTLSALPPVPALVALYASAAAFLAVAALCRRRPSPTAWYALGALSAWLLPVAGAAVVSAVSLYLYESPIHHCPFDFLQADYGYFGYPFYASLAAGTFFGLLPAVFEPLKGVGSLRPRLEGLQQRWAAAGAFGIGLFLVLVTGSILTSNLRLGP